MSNTVTPLTNGELSKLTGTPYYVIQYLDRLGKLPKEKESTGKGDPSIFHPDSIQIVKNHVSR
jgi:hypothetical protein